MKFRLVFLITILVFLSNSCSKEKEKISIIEEENLEMQMIKAYNEGLKELERGDPVYEIISEIPSNSKAPADG